MQAPAGFGRSSSTHLGPDNAFHSRQFSQNQAAQPAQWTTFQSNQNNAGGFGDRRHLSRSQSMLAPQQWNGSGGGSLVQRQPTQGRSGMDYGRRQPAPIVTQPHQPHSVVRRLFVTQEEESKQQQQPMSSMPVMCQKERGGEDPGRRVSFAHQLPAVMPVSPSVKDRVRSTGDRLDRALVANPAYKHVYEEEPFCQTRWLDELFKQTDQRHRKEEKKRRKRHERMAIAKVPPVSVSRDNTGEVELLIAIANLLRDAASKLTQYAERHVATIDVRE